LIFHLNDGLRYAPKVLVLNDPADRSSIGTFPDTISCIFSPRRSRDHRDHDNQPGTQHPSSSNDHASLLARKNGDKQKGEQWTVWTAQGLSTSP